MQDSNLQMSFWKMPFEMSGGFRLIPTHLGTRDFRAFPEKMEPFLPPDRAVRVRDDIDDHMQLPGALHMSGSSQERRSLISFAVEKHAR